MAAAVSVRAGNVLDLRRVDSFLPQMAYHEAGHAVAGHAVGCEIQQIEITPRGGAVTCHVAATAGTARGMMLAAGALAEFRYVAAAGHARQAPAMSDYDANRFVELMDELKIMRVDRPAYRRKVLQMADQILDVHWSTVERVASYLMDRTNGRRQYEVVLTGEAFRRLL